jgi:hypothetical protein
VVVVRTEYKYKYMYLVLVVPGTWYESNVSFCHSFFGYTRSLKVEFSLCSKCHNIILLLLLLFKFVTFKYTKGKIKTTMTSSMRSSLKGSILRVMDTQEDGRERFGSRLAFYFAAVGSGGSFLFALHNIICIYFALKI